MKPQDGYIACIVNPKSGRTSSAVAGRAFTGYLNEGGFDVRISLTASLSHACDTACDAAVDYRCAMVVVVGGDGTAREVAHGLEGSDKPMLIIPSGTENLLANELGLDGRLASAIRTFEHGRIRRLDLGRVNGRCFTSIVGVGFDGRVVAALNRKRSGHIDYFDYFWPLWRTFWRYDFPPVAVKADEEDIFEGRGLVFVGNISRYALGLQILQHADYSDGKLDVCIYRCASRPHLIKHSAFTALKRHAGCRDVVYRRAERVIVTAPAARIETEMDGDPGPLLPLDIEVVPGAVACLLPLHARPAGIRTHICRAFR